MCQSYFDEPLFQSKNALFQDGQREETSGRVLQVRYERPNGRRTSLQFGAESRVISLGFNINMIGNNSNVVVHACTESEIIY